MFTGSALFYRLFHHPFMRTAKFLPLFLLCALAVSAVVAAEPPTLVGSWKGTFQEKPVTTAYAADKTFVSTYDDETLTGTYKTDFTQKPAHLTMQIKGQGTVRVIFEFVSPNEIRIENSEPDEPRPTRFTDAAIVMKRQ
jgi:hypothetical protein